MSGATGAGGLPPALFVFPGARAPRNRMVSHGQGRLAQDQAAFDGRHRLFLRDQEERPHQDGEVRVQEIRSGRAQARRIQGNQDQVSSRQAQHERKAPSGAFLFSGVRLRMFLPSWPGLSRPSTSTIYRLDARQSRDLGLPLSAGERGATWMAGTSPAMTALTLATPT